uniref:hypothetical protein n=1 Tax=unclassified Pseudopelagicola TaxID=2649563 RepID=UPI003EBE854D
MQRHRYLCPAHRCIILIFLLLAFPSFAASKHIEEQIWSVHAFGIKVGELTIKADEGDGYYQGQGSFQTTGLAGILRRIQFNISSRGEFGTFGYQPLTYSGYIDTGRRISETMLEFFEGMPIKISGAQNPAVAIKTQAKNGAHDPMTVMWRVLRLQTEGMLCKIDQKQFDGTRLVHIVLTNRNDQTGDSVTCSGTYNRIGGYSVDELAEMKISPISVTYSKTAAGWRADALSLTTRHGKARLYRRD